MAIAVRVIEFSCSSLIHISLAILWLHNRGFVHRDLSNGNLLLAREQPTTFTGPSKRAVKVGGCEEEVTLVRRRLHEPKDIFGLVHDLDMAARAAELVIGISFICAP
jgi:serine/threonine protein kinase